MTMKRVGILFIIAMFTLTILSNTEASANSKVTFPDVPNSLDGYDEIYYLVEKGVIHGFPEGVFKPKNLVTRGQAAIMVILAGGYEPLVVSTSSFDDIDIKRKPDLSGYVERAVSLGFFDSITNRKFNPDQPLTRGEMSKVLATALKLNIDQYASFESPFSDINTDNKYHKYINALYYNGLTVGAYGKYSPNDQLTREHFSMFVARAINEAFRLPVDVAGVHFPDESKYIGKVAATDNYLYVRSTPSTANKANIVGQVNKGHVFDAYSIEGDWIKVTYNNRYAYVSAQYLKFVDQNGNPLGSKLYSVVAADNVSVYVKNDENSNILGAFVNGAIIDVYGVTGDWYLTKVNNQPGYIKISQTSSQQVTEPTDLIGRATANSVRVRTAPTTSGEIIGELNRGDEVSVLSINGFWAKVLYNDKEGYVHKTYLKLLNQSGSPLNGRIIVLDPGHGGSDPGAVRLPYMEKTIVFSITNILKQKLEKDGAIVHLTRTSDTYQSLENRVKFAQDHYAEIFVSIHTNSAEDPAALGTETFYSVTANDNEKEDNALASSINSQIVKNANTVNRGVKRKDFYVIRHSVFPSVLVELAFLSNQNDRAKLTSPEYQEIFADSIYKGIVEYYQK
ncbi:hypothetical protein CD29_01835 [Ureibacillus manganicus DSM 26584]|uniref:N-acetylmuramoyl-L-alanine amidase n=2 Tax=Ureibacillus TaxID=160795 RepID=A0A0A3I9E6_9BACL|nr:hypothetical protein CD29_01835 [Ureibacillus manganicus DSM 26584]